MNDQHTMEELLTAFASAHSLDSINIDWRGSENANTPYAFCAYVHPSPTQNICGYGCGETPSKAIHAAFRAC